MQTAANTPECPPRLKCAVCLAGPAAHYRDGDDERPEADFARVYAALAAPHVHAPDGALQDMLTRHGGAIDLAVVRLTNAFHCACFEGNLVAAHWLIARLGFTVETTLFDALSCIDFTTRPDGWVDNLDYALGVDRQYDRDEEYRKRYLFLKELTIRGYDDIANWIFRMFADNGWMRKMAAANFISEADSAAIARRYANAFSLMWGDIEAAISVVPGDNLVMLVFKCNPGLLVLLMSELGCPVAAMKRAFAELRAGGTGGLLHAEYLALEAHLRVSGFDV